MALSAILYFLPVIPTLSAGVVLDPTYEWVMMSAASSIQNVNILGVSNQYFGVASGSAADIMNILYILTAGYIISCAIFYLFHATHK